MPRVQIHPARRQKAISSGFTLVEMLVAVTLVLLMMTMFAQIFQMAGGSISKQRGLSENDQRSRTLQTIIKADLDKRSFRWVYPFAANENVSAPESNIGKRQGYLSISENNPFNVVDDFLQFTVVSTIKDRNKDETPYYGQALNYNNFPGFPGAYSTTPFVFFNQPDADDAQVSVNNTGLSTVAEVSYFVRNGNLYRRQLLIREPLAAAGSNPQPSDVTSSNPNGKDVFDPSSSAAFHYPSTGPFWAHFDYSAYYDPASGSAKFLGSDALDNSGSVANSIAAPFRRFGHYHYDASNVFYSGRPKEFASNDSSNSGFLIPIGRFTQHECSDLNFRYPQNSTSGGNFPTSPINNLTLDPISYAVNGPDDFTNGSRRGEDLLLSNVHAFDVQVWDGAAGGGFGAFVNIGDTNAVDYSMSNRLNSSFGPRLPAVESWPTVVNACFDTWHPTIDIDGSGGNDNPPFHPLNRNPAAVGTWATGTSYSASQEVFPNVVEQGYPFFYRCISGSTTTGKAAPTSWPQAAGLTFTDSNGAVWQAVENRKPLKAIKIEIRFVDPSTQQMRQLTIVHSLVD